MKNYTDATEKEKSDFHYEIYKARKEKGLLTFGTHDVPDHPLLGKTVSVDWGRVGDDIQEVVIQRVYVEWYWGMYHLNILIMNNQNSHRVRHIGMWKQEYNMASIMNRARLITNHNYVKYFEDEEE
jgi:hypothetical protein